MQLTFNQGIYGSEKRFLIYSTHEYRQVCEMSLIIVIPQKDQNESLHITPGRYTHRNKAMAEAHRSGHYNLSEAGNNFGVNYGTVSRAVKKHPVSIGFALVCR